MGKTGISCLGVGRSLWELVLYTLTVRCLSDSHVMSREPWLHGPGAEGADLATLEEVTEGLSGGGKRRNQGGGAQGCQRVEVQKVPGRSQAGCLLQ